MADLASDETNKVKEFQKRWPHSFLSFLTIDGIHMNGEGNEMMAAGVLKALGFTDAQLAQEKSVWLDLPAMGYTATVSVTVKQSEQLRDLAERQGMNMTDFMNKEFQKAIPTILS